MQFKFIHGVANDFVLLDSCDDLWFKLKKILLEKQQGILFQVPDYRADESDALLRCGVGCIPKRLFGATICFPHH
jgi:hypothetical protein